MKIIIATHGPLADAFKESSRMFYGDSVEDISTVGLYPNDNPEDLMNKISDVIEDQEEGSDILILVDIQSGSPFNMSALVIDQLKDRFNIECVSGINLPIVMEVLAMKNSNSLDGIISHIESIVADTVVNLRKTLEI